MTTTTENSTDAVAEAANDAFAPALEVVGDWKERTVDFVREHPVACLAGAFLIGFVIAKAARHA